MLLGPCDSHLVHITSICVQHCFSCPAYDTSYNIVLFFLICSALLLQVIQIEAKLLLRLDILSLGSCKLRVMNIEAIDQRLIRSMQLDLSFYFLTASFGAMFSAFFYGRTSEW